MSSLINATARLDLPATEMWRWLSPKGRKANPSNNTIQGKQKWIRNGYIDMFPPGNFVTVSSPLPLHLEQPANLLVEGRPIYQDRKTVRREFLR